MGKFNPKELSKLGYTDNVAKSIAIEIINKHCKHYTKEQITDLLQHVIQKPEAFRSNEIWGKLVDVMSPHKKETYNFKLHEDPLFHQIYGIKNIDELARLQMATAMRLPVAIAGALMPDGCAGYGLPIGGVLATTDDVVIPYAIGKDIACSMCLTILDANASFLVKNHDRIINALVANTAFGLDGTLPYKQYHTLFDKSEFREIPILKKNREKAIRQIGSSGKGNHFVDICEVKLHNDNRMGMAAGTYIGILSHSGSRGLGAAIADFYTSIAKETCLLPRQAGPFAWLSIKSEAGLEYWKCMEIAGEYAKINHETIHRNIAKAMRLTPLISISNHHNFAWRDQLSNGENVIVHRKGATPAHQGELGIIPGSMATPGYIVSGKGCEASLFSASHGAGRTMSRLNARNSISRYALKKELTASNITLIGGSTEEAPLAYKNIETVMAAQHELVNIEGTVIPRIVRMSEE